MQRFGGVDGVAGGFVFRGLCQFNSGLRRKTGKYEGFLKRI